MWGRTSTALLWAAVAVLSAAPLAQARNAPPLEDSLSHLEYARLFDAFHSWSARLGKEYPSPASKRHALTAFYYVRRARTARLP
jgi:hypothetical protein